MSSWSSSASAKADDTKCLSNLRHLGIGINLYANDNDDHLPGPIEGGLDRRLTSTINGNLLYRLQPYLGLPTPTATIVYPEILHCPALQGEALSGNANWYDVVAFGSYSNNDLPPNKRYLRSWKNETGQDVGVWGRRPSGTSDAGGAAARRSMLQELLDPSKVDAHGNPPILAMVPAIREIDASQKNWPWSVPPRPVHGDHQNVLFFDWHVGPVDPKHFSMK